MYRVVMYLCVLGAVLSGISCTPHRTALNLQEQGIIYTYGDASYERQLQEGKVPMKWGSIPAAHVSTSFPKKFLEPDGRYGGGRVYRTIEEAEAAVKDAENKNILSKGEAWGIYQVEGDWETNTYELYPNDFRLRQTAPIIKKIR